MCSAMKPATRACSARTFSECSNSMAGSFLKGSTIVSYDLFVALPIERSPVDWPGSVPAGIPQIEAEASGARANHASIGPRDADRAEPSRRRLPGISVASSPSGVVGVEVGVETRWRKAAPSPRPITRLAQASRGNTLLSLGWAHEFHVVDTER